MARTGFMQSVLILTLFALIAIITSNSQSFGTKGGIEQIPSEPTDFPSDNPDLIKVDVTSANKDSIGFYHVIGDIKNLGNDTLQNVQVIGHFYDDNNKTIGVTTCCYADPSDIEPGHTATFDSFVNEEDISGKPTSFRLSFEWD